MSRFVLVCVLSVSAVLAAPQLRQQGQNTDPNGIELLRYNFTNNNEAGYAFT